MAETIGGLLCRAGAVLRAAGVENARAEARRLLAHALGVDAGTLVARAHDAADAPGFDALLARRAAREPMAYITGAREFWGMPFHVTPDVLIPRPDSETLVEAALEAFPDRRAVARVLDLGTGSGALLAAALREFGAATGVGVDRSGAALAVAQANLAALGLGARTRWIEGGWDVPIDGRFDLVLCNPPYVEDAALAALDPELAHEPRGALAAGADGLDAYRALLPTLPARLVPGAVAIVELGAGQAAAVAALAPWAETGLRHDLAAIPRALVLRQRMACIGKQGVPNAGHAV
jgi:release factor glutamine methyltransferase